jgi:hypothetical protein
MRCTPNVVYVGGCQVWVQGWEVGKAYSSLYIYYTYNQWPFQEPKLEVPTIYKAYIRPM